MWLRQRGRLAYSYRTKPKMWRTKRSQKFYADMAARPVPVSVNLPASVRLCVRLCVFVHAPIQQRACPVFVRVYSSMCSYAHTVCARSHVAVQLFYQAVTECQPLCVRGETAERRLLPSSSPHSDDYCLVITPPLFSPHGTIWMGPPQQCSLTQPGS